VRFGLFILAIIGLLAASPKFVLAYDDLPVHATHEARTDRTDFASDSYATPIYIRRIEIRGLKKTRPITVLRELPFTTGDAWRDSDKATGERRLRNTGLFAEAIITPPDENGVVDIWVRDRWSLFLLPEASRSDIGKTSAGFALTEHNMWGLHHQVRIASREETGKNFSSLKGTTASGSYLWRRINNGPIDLSVSASTGRRVFDAFQDAQLSSQYEERNVNWGTRVSYAFGPVPGEGWSSILGFTSDTSNFTLVSGPIQTNVINRRRNAMQAGVAYRFIDDNITWLTGTNFDYTWDIAHKALGSSINSYRQTGSLSSHIPLTDGGTTFDFRVNGGGVTGNVLRDGLFDIGNNHGLRGYLPGELQGTYYLYSNLEGRMPIKPGSNFQLVGFTDVGQIWNSGTKALGKNLIVGVGAGARLTLRWLVHGTFRSDVAYGLATSRWRFYFGTGQAF